MMDTRITAYHVYRTPSPRSIGWSCDAADGNDQTIADGNDQTIADGYGKTPQSALKNCMKAVKKSEKR